MAADGDELLGVLIVKADELQQIMITAAARGRGVGGLLSPRPSTRSPPPGMTRSGWPWCPATPRHGASTRATAGSDRGEETYDAVTLGGGTVAVPVCRYVKGLNMPTSS